METKVELFYLVVQWAGQSHVIAEAPVCLFVCFSAVIVENSKSPVNLCVVFFSVQEASQDSYVLRQTLNLIFLENIAVSFSV